MNTVLNTFDIEKGDSVVLSVLLPFILFFKELKSFRSAKMLANKVAAWRDSKDNCHKFLHFLVQLFITLRNL